MSLQLEHVVPSTEASALPWTRERCWFAMVKKELPETSSQRSNPVLFLKRACQSLITQYSISQSWDLPVFSYIVQIVVYDGPEDARGCGSVAVVDEPVGVSDEGNGPESWTVPLWPP